MQRTKQSTTSETQTEEEVPTEVNEQSAKVSEDACCLIAEIDSILEDCAKEKEPEPVPEVAEWDPWDALPDEPKPWDDKYWNNESNSMDHAAFEADSNDYLQKALEWHDVRGLEFDVEGFATKRAESLGSCTC